MSPVSVSPTVFDGVLRLAAALGEQRRGRRGVVSKSGRRLPRN